MQVNEGESVRLDDSPALRAGCFGWIRNNRVESDDGELCTPCRFFKNRHEARVNLIDHFFGTSSKKPADPMRKANLLFFRQDFVQLIFLSHEVSFKFCADSHFFDSGRTFYIFSFNQLTNGTFPISRHPRPASNIEAGQHPANQRRPADIAGEMLLRHQVGRELPCNAYPPLELLKSFDICDRMPSAGADFRLYDHRSFELGKYFFQFFFPREKRQDPKARNRNAMLQELVFEHKFIVPIPAHIQRLRRDWNTFKINCLPFHLRAIVIKGLAEEKELLHFYPP